MKTLIYNQSFKLKYFSFLFFKLINLHKDTRLYGKVMINKGSFPLRFRYFCVRVIGARQLFFYI